MKTNWVLLNYFVRLPLLMLRWSCTQIEHVRVSLTKTVKKRHKYVLKHWSAIIERAINTQAGLMWAIIKPNIWNIKLFAKRDTGVYNQNTCTQSNVSIKIFISEQNSGKQSFYTWISCVAMFGCHCLALSSVKFLVFPLLAYKDFIRNLV